MKSVKCFYLKFNFFLVKMPCLDKIPMVKKHDFKFKAMLVLDIFNMK